MRRLHPSPPADVTSIRDAYDADRTLAPGRPWIGVCMVASLDGSTSVGGRSSGLSSPNDTKVLLALRSLADVIIVGAGTVRAEGYGPPKRAGQRVGVVTNSAKLDLASPLFTSGAGFLICPDSAAAEGVETLRAGEDTVDLGDALSRIVEIAPGARFVQAEGGARLNGTLAELDLIDELNLTLSSKVVGGIGPRVTSGSTDEVDARFELAHLLVDDDSFVFSRWVRRRAC